MPRHVRGAAEPADFIPVPLSPVSTPHPPPAPAAVPRGLKYLALAVLLPVCGFATMAVVAPLTAGAHDGGFLGMALGLFLAQVAFAHVLLGRNRKRSALLVFLGASVASWGAMFVLAENPELFGLPRDPYGTETSGTLLGAIFLVLYALASVGLWEIAYRATYPDEP